MLIRSYTTLLTVALSLAAACRGPSTAAPHATSQAAAPGSGAAAMNAAPAAGTQRLAISPANSTIGFVGSKVTASHEGSFHSFTGTLDLSPEHLEASHVAVDIVMQSVTVDPDRLNQHLRSPDFFNVAAFPHATFASTEIRPGGESGATHTIVGMLTLHGVTRQITFPATIRVTPTEVTATSEFSINRRDFGIVYPGMPDDLIRDGVVIRLNLRAPRA